MNSAGEKNDSFDGINGLSVEWSVDDGEEAVAIDCSADDLDLVVLLVNNLPRETCKVAMEMITKLKSAAEVRGQQRVWAAIEECVSKNSRNKAQ